MKRIVLPLLCFSSFLLHAQTLIPVGYNPPASLVAATGNDTAICQGCSTTLMGSAGAGTAPYTYSWSPTTGLSDPTIANPTATPTTTTTYTLTVTDDRNCTATSDMEVIVGTIGIEEDFLERLSVSPIPANGTVLLDFGQQVNEDLAFEVVSINGQSVIKGTIPNGSSRHQLDISVLSNGSYILRISLGSAVSTRKIVVNH